MQRSKNTDVAYATWRSKHSYLFHFTKKIVVSPSDKGKDHPRPSEGLHKSIRIQPQPLAQDAVPPLKDVPEAARNGYGPPKLPGGRILSPTWTLEEPRNASSNTQAFLATGGPHNRLLGRQALPRAHKPAPHRECTTSRLRRAGGEAIPPPEACATPHVWPIIPRRTQRPPRRDTRPRRDGGRGGILPGAPPAALRLLKGQAHPDSIGADVSPARASPAAG